MSKTTPIKPVIQDGEIKEVEIGEVSLPLKEPVPLEKLPQLIEVFEQFSKYVDMNVFETVEEQSKDKEWREDDLMKFVTTQLWDDQSMALEVLVQNTEVTRGQFIDKMKKKLGNEKFRGWDLGGLLAGITAKSRSWGYESPYTSDYKTVEKEWECLYRLTREEYRPIIQKALKERK